MGVTEDNIRPQVDNLIVDRKLVAKGEAVFAAPYYYAELNCANMLRNLNIPMAESENLPSQDMAIRKRLERMAENLAKCLGLPADRVNVKATTEERLGFTGDGSGMAAQAAALLERLPDGEKSGTGTPDENRR